MHNGGILLVETLDLDNLSAPSTAEAAAAAIEAAVRRDPAAAFRAKQGPRGFSRSASGTTVSASGTPTSSAPSSVAATPTNQSNSIQNLLQLRLSRLIDLLTCSGPAVQTHIVTVIGLLVPCMSNPALTELLDCGLIFMLCSLYVDPPCEQVRTSALRTTNALLRLTLETPDLSSKGATLVKALLDADVCDVITDKVVNFSVGSESNYRKEEILEAIILLEKLATQPAAKGEISCWTAADPTNTGRFMKQYPVAAVDVLLGRLASSCRTDDELINMIIVKICNIAVHVAMHCSSRTTFLNGTSFTASCIEISCDSQCDVVAYHAVIFLSCVSYLPSFSLPLLQSHRHIRLCERALCLAVPCGASTSNVSNPLFFRSSADVVLHILYQAAANSVLQTLSMPTQGSAVEDDYLNWEAYSLFLTVARSDNLWANIATVLKSAQKDIPYVVVRIIHVMASYKDLEVLETLWAQLQKYDITQLLINMGATLVRTISFILSVPYQQCDSSYVLETNYHNPFTTHCTIRWIPTGWTRS
jgi:hypothetical protein